MTKYVDTSLFPQELPAISARDPKLKQRLGLIYPHRHPETHWSSRDTVTFSLHPWWSSESIPSLVRTATGAIEFVSEGIP